jgi:positive regulator of sigma E activity
MLDKLNITSNLSKTQVKYLLTIMAVSSIIIGYFFDKISSEIFYSTVGGIIAHFYQESKVRKLEETVEEQSVKLQSIDGKEKNI